MTFYRIRTPTPLITHGCLHKLQLFFINDNFDDLLGRINEQQLCLYYVDIFLSTNVFHFDILFIFNRCGSDINQLVQVRNSYMCLLLISKDFDIVEFHRPHWGGKRKRIIVRKIAKRNIVHTVQQVLRLLGVTFSSRNIVVII